MNQQTAIIIGGGPAGLTAAYELLTRTEIRPIVLEASGMMGGISRTVNYKGNRIDIGGHRFFSKSDRVMRWWLDMMPLDCLADSSFTIQYQNQTRDIENAASAMPPPDANQVMLVRSRKSRIFFLRKFFDYPIRLCAQTLLNLGLVRTAKILASYLHTKLFPIKSETNLEEFFINRFGRELYLTFFKSYTEKVWGVPCQEISAEWGAQRIKGLSITRAVTHAIKRLFRRDGSLSQKGVETSLIERFLYPKFGPGQMWETCAEKVRAKGGEIITNVRVERLEYSRGRIATVIARDVYSDDIYSFPADYVFSTMPVRELVNAFDGGVPENVQQVSDGLVYRDFITVGVLLDELKIQEQHADGQKLLKDNWIYIQESDVHVGRLQIFNNWSPSLVADPNSVWLGMEYFCNETDPLWKLPDEEMRSLAIAELGKLGFIEPSRVRDATVIRVPKTYPAYFGTYGRFQEVRDFLDPIENLFLVGRNGMHRYNNQDHSMLTAMTAVDNIIAGITDKSNIWNVNTEQEYHEERDTRIPANKANQHEHAQNVSVTNTPSTASGSRNSRSGEFQETVKR